MNEADPAAPLPPREGDYRPESYADYDDFNPLDERAPGDVAAGLTSLGFLVAALRRGVRLWLTLGLIGMLCGVGYYTYKPPPYQASTTLLMSENPGLDPLSAIEDDQTLAETQVVAAKAAARLGLNVTPVSFLGQYTVTVVTTKVLQFTVRAPSTTEAVHWADVIAATFLDFRAHVLESQDEATNAALHQQVTQAQIHVNSLVKQITQLTPLATTPAAKLRLDNLRTEHRQAAGALTTLRQTVNGNAANSQVLTDSMIDGSQVLDTATPIHKSRFKQLILYTLIGLIGGMPLGMVIVILRAFTSDRLRRRDDVARALGAPVRLSVRAVRLSRWRESRRGLGAADLPEIRRIVAYLRGSVVRSRGLASLAVVPVDNVQVPAACVAAMAVSCARQGLQVVVADLCDGGPAARLLGSTGPGIQSVSIEDARLLVAVPEPDDLMPAGPLGRGSRRSQDAGPLAAACDSADLLLTLVTLDPALGGDHLGSWARTVVAVVTAGQSSATRANAAGEMIRLAGVPAISGVLIGADKTDESLGLPDTPVTVPDAGPADRDLLNLARDDGSVLPAARGRE